MLLTEVGGVELLLEHLNNYDSLLLPEALDLAHRDRRSEIFHHLIHSEFGAAVVLYDGVDLLKFVRLEYLVLHEAQDCQGHPEKYYDAFDEEQVPHCHAYILRKIACKEAHNPLESH